MKEMKPMKLQIFAKLIVQEVVLNVLDKIHHTLIWEIDPPFLVLLHALVQLGLGFLILYIKIILTLQKVLM